jgi:hypothetical protein
VKDVGLAMNMPDVEFRCGTCGYYDRESEDQGKCTNPHPRLKGRMLSAYWCCNHYDHKGMIVIEE